MSNTTETHPNLHAVMKEIVTEALSDVDVKDKDRLTNNAAAILTDFMVKNPHLITKEKDLDKLSNLAADKIMEPDHDAVPTTPEGKKHHEIAQAIRRYVKNELGRKVQEMTPEEIDDIATDGVVFVADGIQDLLEDALDKHEERVREAFEKDRQTNTQSNASDIGKTLKVAGVSNDDVSGYIVTANPQKNAENRAL